MRRNTMAYPYCPNTFDTRSKVVSAVVALWRIFLRARRRSADSKHIGPLLQRLVVVLRAKRSIYRAMPEFLRSQYVVHERTRPGTYACAVVFRYTRDTSPELRHPSAAQSRWTARQSRCYSMLPLPQMQRRNIQPVHPSIETLR